MSGENEEKRGNAVSGENEGGEAGRRESGDALYELRRALERVADVSRGVRGDVAEANRVRRRDNTVTLVLAAVIVLLLAGALTLTVQNAKIARQNREISRQVADCTTAGGRCYQEGQRRTGEAVADIARMQVLVEVCGSQPGVDTVAEVQRCVQQRAG